MPTIVRRARPGNSTEDISYLGNGQMAVLDGYDLFLVPFAQTIDPRVKTRKLFDVKQLAVTGAPRGVAYLAAEGLYAFNDLRRRSTILLAGAKGQPAGERTLQYPVTNRAVVTTLDGSLVGDFNTRKSLGVLDPGDVAEITSGEEAGPLSIIDRSSNELVVFSMDAGTV